MATEKQKLRDLKYRKIELIGQGGYHRVYKCWDGMNHQYVAVKVVSRLSESEGVDYTNMRESALLFELNHVNIVKLLEINSTGRDLFLVFECLDTDLSEHIKNEPQSFQNPVLRKKYMQQILCGLEYCHSHNVIHRDMKPSNLLINKDEEIVKLADFGLSISSEVPAENYSVNKVTVAYMAPEVLCHFPVYSTLVDIWSAGCIFGEMVKQRRVFSGGNEHRNREAMYVDQLRAIFRMLGTPTEETWPGAISRYSYLENFGTIQPKNLEEEFIGLESTGVDLISRMLKLDPRERITAQDAVPHPYFEAL